GERHTHRGASVKSVLKAENRRALGVCTGNLDRVLDSFGPGIYKEGPLRKATGCQPVHRFRKLDVALVQRNLRANVHEAIRLSLNGGCDGHRPMTRIEAPDPAGQIDECIAIHVLDECSFGAGNKDGSSLVQPAGNHVLALPLKLSGTRTRDGGA